MKLSSTESVLLNFMRSKGIGTDVPIATVWRRLQLEAATGDMPSLSPVDHEVAQRTMQQYVGAFVSRVNNKQDVYEIIPGELKRTYRVQLKQKNT